jgi:hypothetical protein
VSVPVLSLPLARLAMEDDAAGLSPAGVVYDHLRFYHSLGDLLPAVAGRVDEKGDVLVSSRRLYARLARDLGRERVRVVLDPASDPAGVAKLVQDPDVERLSWAEIDAAERGVGVARAWQVFFFARPLTEAEQHAFDEEVVGLFARVPALFPESVQLGADDHPRLSTGRDGELLYFEAVQPTGDQVWMRDYIAAIRAFSARRVEIVTFQGRKVV